MIVQKAIESAQSVLRNDSIDVRCNFSHYFIIFCKMTVDVILSVIYSRFFFRFLLRLLVVFAGTGICEDFAANSDGNRSKMGQEQACFSIIKVTNKISSGMIQRGNKFMRCAKFLNI